MAQYFASPTPSHLLASNSLLDKFNHMINSVLEPLIPDATTHTILIVAIAMLAGLSTQSPLRKNAIVNNMFVRVGIMFLAVWLSTHDAVLATATIIVFLAAATVFKPTIEGFDGPQTMVFPGCLNVKRADLLAAFNNDMTALQNAILMSKVPASVSAITDDNAPLIASYLIGHNFPVKTPCVMPQVSDRMDMNY